MCFFLSYTGANHGESAADNKLPGCRRSSIHAMGTRLDLPDWILLLFRHAQYHRLWRLRPGYQPRRLGVTGKAGSLCSVSVSRAVADSDVL